MEQVGRTLDNFLDKTGLKKQIDARQYITCWSKAVGSHIQKYTRPLTVKDHILWVEVTDSTWLYHLTMIKLKIIVDLNTRIGQDMIKDIRFVNADFRSQNYPRDKVRKKKARRKNMELPKVVFLMKEEDKIKLEHAIQQSPRLYRPLLQKMFQSCYRQQRWKEEKGAAICQNCNMYVWEHEMKEGLCPCCFPLVHNHV